MASIVEFLAGNSDGWGVPLRSARWSCSDALEPLQLEVVDLCWPRDDDEVQSGFGHSALRLPDAWLEEAHRRYGCLTYDRVGKLKKGWAGSLELIDLVFGGADIAPEAFIEALAPGRKAPLWSLMPTPPAARKGTRSRLVRNLRSNRR